MDIVHRIILGTGNVTACGLGIGRARVGFDKKFSTNMKSVTCDYCINYEKHSDGYLSTEEKWRLSSQKEKRKKKEQQKGDDEILALL
jgi:hypothetical protein